MFKNFTASLLLIGFILPFYLLNSASSYAQSSIENTGENLETAQRINELAELISQKTEQRDALRKLLNATGQNIDDEDRKRLVTITEDLQSLKESFLFAVLGNKANIQALDDVVVAETTWQQDVVDILKPLADTLKSVTRRPREVAALRERIEIVHQKSAAIQNALSASDQIDSQTLSAISIKSLGEYRIVWNQELEQAKQDGLLAESQLNSLLTNNGSGWSGVWASTKQFFFGRGLTLLLAIVSAVISWFLMRYLWWLYSTKIASKEIRRQSTLYRFAAYSYYLITGFTVVLAILFTLWVREDLLLLAITFVALASLALGFRQYLPNYITEARLLLNVGNVREDERVVYDGLPWQVMSLNIQSVLRNPAIDGVLRLPLSIISTLSSRPVKNNLWFPTKKGDYVVLPDGTFGRIACQTPDLVEISVKGGITVTFPTSTFFSLQVLNLSGNETFGVSTTFGLDYNLQPICLTTVPNTLRAEIHSALVLAGYEKYVEAEMVELQSASESSLDYLVFITMSSEVASDFYALERLLVQTCIDASNANDWSIPFPQLTLHNAIP